MSLRGVLFKKKSFVFVSCTRFRNLYHNFIVNLYSICKTGTSLKPHIFCKHIIVSVNMMS